MDTLDILGEASVDKGMTAKDMKEYAGLRMFSGEAERYELVFPQHRDL